MSIINITGKTSLKYKVPISQYGKDQYCNRKKWAKGNTNGALKCEKTKQKTMLYLTHKMLI